MKKQRYGYHIFTDNKDSYSDTLKEAKKQYQQWKKEGYTNLRIYRLYADSEEEDYVKGEGCFPA